MATNKLTFFAGGVGAVLDIFPVPRRINIERHQPELSDWERLSRDGRVVAEHLWAATNAAGVEVSRGKEEQAAESPSEVSGEPGGSGYGAE